MECLLPRCADYDANRFRLRGNDTCCVTCTDKSPRISGKVDGYIYIKAVLLVTEFTPIASLVGGALIGLSAVLLMLTLGRIMGATGILGGALFPASAGDRGWRLALLAGMITAPWVFKLLTGSLPAIQVPIPPLMIAIGGLIVGVGVTLAGGCTSGHGVCGLARISRRSMVAVLSFMFSTAVTVFVIRHVLGLGS